MFKSTQIKFAHIIFSFCMTVVFLTSLTFYFVAAGPFHQIKNKWITAEFMKTELILSFVAGDRMKRHILVGNEIIKKLSSAPSEQIDEGLPINFDFVDQSKQILAVSQSTTSLFYYQRGLYFQLLSKVIPKDYRYLVPDTIQSQAQYYLFAASDNPENNYERLYALAKDNTVLFNTQAKLSDFTVSNRSWNKSLQLTDKKGPQVSIAKPYIDHITNQKLLTVLHSMKGEGKVQILGRDIDPSRVTRYLESAKISPNSRSAIILNEDIVLGTNKIKKAANSVSQISTFEELNDSIFQKIKTLAIPSSAQKHFMNELDIDGEEYIVSQYNYTIFEDNSLQVLAYAPADELGKDLQKMMQNIIMATGVLIFLSIIASIYFSQMILRPLHSISGVAKAIGELDLSQPIKEKSVVTEINALQKSITNMRNGLDMFVRYVPKKYVERIVHADSGNKIGGELRDITLMFSDIKGFTTLSENIEPEDLLRHISAYFETMSDPINQFHGTIDKFIGDSVMAFWNAPDDDPNHVQNACLSALFADKNIQIFNEKATEYHLPALTTRFGLHKGPCVVGNLGAEKRMNYTALGAPVNIASRLEGMNKLFDTRILISEAVETNLPETFVRRKLGIIEPVGSHISLAIYELRSYETMDGYLMEVANAKIWEEAYNHLCKGNFNEAEILFKTIANVNEEDKAIIHFIKLVENSTGPWNEVLDNSQLIKEKIAV